VPSDPTPPPTVATSPPLDATVATTQDNVAATRTYSTWLLHAVPMPADAREWTHSPTSHYRHGSIGIGPSDSDFTRTTWWTVSLSPDAFGTWLRDHAPRSLRFDSDSGGQVESTGVWEHDVDFQTPSTTAHTRAWVNFAFVPQGRDLVVRVDTFVGARFARTVFVPEDTTSVVVRRTSRSWDNGHTRPRSVVRTVTDKAAVERLVAMINGLPGAMTTQFVASCPASLSERSYTMTFVSPDGTYVASLPTTMCWPRLSLSRNGTKVDPPLDPGRTFARAADRSLR